MNISHFFLAVVYLTLLHTVFGNIKIAAESTFDNADNTAEVGSTYQYRRSVAASSATTGAASTPFQKRRTTAALSATTAAFSDPTTAASTPFRKRRTTAAFSDPTTAASTTFRKRRTTAAIHDTTAASSDTTTAASTPFRKRRTTAAIHDTTAASSDTTTAASTPFRKRRTTAAFSDTTTAALPLYQNIRTTTAVLDTTTAASTLYQNHRTTSAGSFENGNEHVSTLFTIVTEEGKRYSAKKGYWNWTESKIECQKIGMELATITTTKELNFLHKYYSKKTFSDGLWIAASDSQQPPASSWDETGTNFKPLPVVTWAIVEGYTVCHQFDPRLPALRLKRCERRANVLCQNKRIG